MCVGRVNELWLVFTQEIVRILVSEGIAMRPTKDGQFDITSSRFFFLTHPTWQCGVVDHIREFYPGKRLDGYPCYISTVVHSLLSYVATLQTLWHQKGWLTDAEVEEGKRAAARLI